MMNIIYEISTGLYLFDVFNENDANGFHYEYLNKYSNSENKQSKVNLIVNMMMMIVTVIIVMMIHMHRR